MDKLTENKRLSEKKSLKSKSIKEMDTVFDSSGRPIVVRRGKLVGILRSE